MAEMTKGYDAVCETRLPAEFLAPETAIHKMKRYETQRTSPGLFHSAWCHAEMGLNQRIDINNDGREFYFETTQMLTGLVIEREISDRDTLLGALILSSYVPLFKKRALNQEISSDDCVGIYNSLGGALRYLRPLSIDEPPQWRMTEVSVLALSARTHQPSLLFYPTSPREEHSDNFAVNHDSYFYNNGDKIPIQQKLIYTDKTYADWITVLTLQPLIDKGLRSTNKRVAKYPLADKVNYLLSLIISETNGWQLSMDEQKFLNFMSEAVAAHRMVKTDDTKTEINMAA